MLESFLEAPNILTDDGVMDLLTFIFRQHPVQEKLHYTIVDRKEVIEAELMAEIEAESERTP